MTDTKVPSDAKTTSKEDGQGIRAARKDRLRIAQHIKRNGLSAKERRERKRDEVGWGE